MFNPFPADLFFLGNRVDPGQLASEAQSGVCAPLIPENNALISPNP